MSVARQAREDGVIGPWPPPPGSEQEDASKAACWLMDRYQLVLQRTAQEGDISRVRAVGPGPAGLPAAWRPTTAEAVADWVAKHGPTYHVLPLDTQANVATLAVDQADGQGDGR